VAAVLEFAGCAPAKSLCESHLFATNAFPKTTMSPLQQQQQQQQLADYYYESGNDSSTIMTNHDEDDRTSTTNTNEQSSNSTKDNQRYPLEPFRYENTKESLEIIPMSRLDHP
jgi:hypothetical protein